MSQDFSGSAEALEMGKLAQPVAEAGWRLACHGVSQPATPGSHRLQLEQL